MATYNNDSFNDPILDKANVTSKHPTGERYCPALQYGNEPQPQCVDCPAWNAADRETIGRHYSTSASGVPAQYRYQADFLRQAQSMLSFFQRVVGWQSARFDYKNNSTGLSNFSTGLIFGVEAASGYSLTLKCNGVDPRNVGVFFHNASPGIGEPLETTTSNGAMPMPGDLIEIGGNSCCSGRIRATITKVNFNTLPTPIAASSTFTVTISHTVNNVMTPADPSNPDKPIAVVWREAYVPEKWVRIDNRDFEFFVPHEREYTALPSGGVIELATPGGASTRCAFPIAYHEPYPGTQAESNLRDTFKLEIAPSGGAYQDVTAALRVLRESDGEYYYQYPRFVIDNNQSRTRLYLGAKDYFDQDQDDLLTGAEKVKVRYCYLASPDTADTKVSMLAGCHHCTEDFNKTVGDMTISGVAKYGNRHFYCALRNDSQITASGNLSAFAWNCTQSGSCKGFRIREIAPVNEYVYAQIWSGANEFLHQLGEGAPIFEVCRSSNPSFIWLTSPDEAFVSHVGYFPLSNPIDNGRYVYYDGFITASGGSQSIKTVRGLLYNYDASDENCLTLDWTNNRWGDTDGILARRASYMPFTQNSEVRASGNDPCRQIYHERAARRIAPFYKDSFFGQNIAFSCRDKAGVEGENRIQRYNRKTRVYLPNIDRNSFDTQGDSATGTVTILPASGTYYGLENVKATVQLYADGQQDFGYKRISGVGFNGAVWRLEAIGGGQYKLHCAPGLYACSKTVVGQDLVDYFWAGGNAVDLPYPYKPDASKWNNGNSKLGGSLAQKAIAGDTVTFNLGDLAGVKFPIVQAEACAGDSFLNATYSKWAMAARVGSHFSFDEHLTQGTPDIQITQYQIKFKTVAGNYEYQFDHNNPAVHYIKDAERPTDNQLDTYDYLNVYLEWDKYWIENGTYTTADGIAPDAAQENKPFIWMPDGHSIVIGDQVRIKNSDSTPSIDGIFTVIMTYPEGFTVEGPAIETNGTTCDYLKIDGQGYIIQGSHKAYLSFPHYSIAFSTSANLLLGRYAKVSYTVNSIAQPDKEIEIKLPQMNLMYSPDWTKPFNVYSFDPHYSEPRQLGYGGTIDSEYTTDLAYGQYYRVGNNTIVFHPNQAGHYIWIEYDLTEPVNIGAYPNNGYIYLWRDLKNANYLKKCDVLTIQDQAGIIANYGTNIFSNAEFYVSTGSILKS